MERGVVVVAHQQAGEDLQAAQVAAVGQAGTGRRVPGRPASASSVTVIEARSHSTGPTQTSSKSVQRGPSGVISTLPVWASPWSGRRGQVSASGTSSRRGAVQRRVRRDGQRRGDVGERSDERGQVAGVRGQGGVQLPQHPPEVGRPSPSWSRARPTATGTPRAPRRRAAPGPPTAATTGGPDAARNRATATSRSSQGSGSGRSSASDGHHAASPPAPGSDGRGRCSPRR